MSRSISDAFKESMMIEVTDEVLVDLIEISSADLTTPLRICDAYENITHNGDLYVARAMELVRAVETLDDTPAEIAISIDDSDLAVLTELEKISPNQDPLALVTYRLILDTDHDFAELTEYYDLKYKEVNEERLIITLQQDNYLLESFPGDTIAPPTHPASFGGDA